MPTEPVILIFDIGKTNKKYFLINEQYKIVHTGSEHFPETIDEDGFPCDNIKLISEWIVSSINNILQLKTFQVKAINFSAHGAGIVNVDADGKVVTPLYNYLKPYPESLTENFYRQYGDRDDISLQTASPSLGSLNSGMQLYRLKYEQPKIFSRIVFSLHLPQYLSFLVSGNLVAEITSIGCHTQLWDFKQNEYHNWVLNEQLNQKFPSIYSSDLARLTNIQHQTIPVGIGLHDSSAALIPYLINFRESFMLISTGTWSISLNPFNHTTLTIEELKQDCLCYLSYQGKLVKASRLFAGYHHDKEMERISSYFNVSPEFYKEVSYNRNLISENEITILSQSVKNYYSSNLEQIDLSKCINPEEAYHQLILQIAVNQVYSAQLVIKNSPVNKIVVDGGFSKNEMYMKLLSSLFPNVEVYAASIGEASAIGAALAIHNIWNKQSIPSDLIELVLEKNNFVVIHKKILTNLITNVDIKPKLKFFDLTMIIVSLVIGVGIFRTPAIVAQKAGTPLIFFLAWIFGGIISICGALTFAEIGSRYPAAGGFYKIFSHCYHPAYAFMLNWSLVIINAASAVAVAIVGAEYINPILLPVSLQNDLGIKLTAVAVILILFGLNYMGIKMGARTQNVLSMAKIILIILFCFAAFGNHHSSTTIIEATQDSGINSIKAFGISLIAVFFSYGGYQSTINFGADIQQPQKNIPKAIFMGIGIVIGLYLTINFAYYSVLGFNGIQHSKLLAAEVAKSFFGENGYAAACVVIFISVLGYLNTALMNNPRVYYAMADDKILPEIFKRVNSKTMTQEFSLSFFVALMLLSLFLLGTFEKIVNYVMFIDSISLVSAAGTIFIFRKRASLNKSNTANEPSSKIYRIKLFPLIPLIFMTVLLIVTINVVITDALSALYGFLIFLAGYPLYKLIKKAVDR